MPICRTPLTVFWSRQPPSSCQTTSQKSPAGESLLSKLPSASVTAKYGWAQMRTQALIQRWVPQEIGIGDQDALKPVNSTCLPAGMTGLPLGLSPGPSYLELCDTGALFLTTSVWSSRMPTQCGSNLQ